MTRTTQLKPMVMIEFSNRCYVTTPEEAGVLMPVLARLAALPRFTYDWAAKLYKPAGDDPYEGVVTLKVYSVEAQQRTAAAVAMDAADTPT